MSGYQSPFPPDAPAIGGMISSVSTSHLGWFLPTLFVGSILGLALVALVSLWLVLLAVVAGAIIAIVNRGNIVAMVGWHPPSLQVDRSILIGDNVTAIYRRAPRKARTLASFSVHGTLVCEEECSFRPRTGNNKPRVVRQRVFSSTFVVNSIEQGLTGPGVTVSPAGIAAPLSLRLPTNVGGPSTELLHNRIRWYLEVSTIGTGLPTDAQRFPLIVDSRLAPNVLEGRSDS